MEEQKDMSGMLELVMQPAFFVKNGIITQINQAARQLLISPETPIETMLGEHAEEYAAFESGCLWLTLNLSGFPMQACTTRMDGFDLFVIEQATDDAQLQAMALTAMGLREPLSDVMTLSDQLLPTEAYAEDSQTRAMIRQMNRRLNQLHRMVCNMTDAIHYAHDTPIRMECRDICSVTEEIFEHAAVLAESAGFRLNYSVPKESILCMIAPERLERAIYNILSNAMKHAPAGSLIEARLTHRGSKLYLTIQDSGSGIPSQLLASLYSRYRRQPGIEAMPSGLGLGMVLIRGTAAAHSGTILIDQPQGQGTRITMSLALRPSGGNTLRSNILHVDYAGERDHGLLELSDVLPPKFYDKV